MKLTTHIAAAFAAGLLCACAPTATPTPSITPQVTLYPTATPTGPSQALQSPLQSPLPRPTTGAREAVWVVFERSGGIAGKTQSWTIYLDGRVVASTGAESRADVAQVTALNTAINAVFARGTTSPAPRPCADCYRYSVLIEFGGKTVALVTNDATANPPELDALLKAVLVFAK